MATVRTDSFAATLTEEQAWALFSKSRRCDWQDAAQWAVKEFGLERMPSRTAFYEWRKRMARDEHEHRMGQAAIAAAEAAALGRKATKDEAIIQALKALATEAALSSDAKTASSLIQSAMAIKDRLQKEAELKLKDRAQGVKEDELKIAKKKLEIMEAKEAAAHGALADRKITDADKLLKIKEIFG